MLKNLTKLIIIVLGIATITSSCSKNKNELELLDNKNIFSISGNQTIIMDGVINSKSLNEFNDLYSKNSSIKQVNIKKCDGSINDEINLKLSQRVHDLGLNTHLVDGGLIASGGVDFFLAGINRTAGENVKIGVHSWAGGGKTAKDFPKGHASHQSYIDYYKAIGFSKENAESFYYFTINAATAESVHWMTKEEILKYNILTPAEIYTKAQLQGIWMLTSLSSIDNPVQLSFTDDNLNFSDFKKVQAQWSLLVPNGMNSFKFTIKNNIVSGKLELSNGALDRYRSLNLNKEMIDLAESWTKEEREIFQILKMTEKSMIISALSRNGKDRTVVFLNKK